MCDALSMQRIGNPEAVAMNSGAFGMGPATMPPLPAGPPNPPVRPTFPRATIPAADTNRDAPNAGRMISPDALDRINALIGTPGDVEAAVNAAITAPPPGPFPARPAPGLADAPRPMPPGPMDDPARREAARRAGDPRQAQRFRGLPQDRMRDEAGGAQRFPAGRPAPEAPAATAEMSPAGQGMLDTVAALLGGLARGNPLNPIGPVPGADAQRFPPLPAAPAAPEEAAASIMVPGGVMPADPMMLAAGQAQRFPPGPRPADAGPLPTPAAPDDMVPLPPRRPGAVAALPPGNDPGMFAEAPPGAFIAPLPTDPGMYAEAPPSAFAGSRAVETSTARPPQPPRRPAQPAQQRPAAPAQPAVPDWVRAVEARLGTEQELGSDFFLVDNWYRQNNAGSYAQSRRS